MWPTSAFYGMIDLLSSLPYGPMLFWNTRDCEPFIESNPRMGAHAFSVSLLQIFCSHVSSSRGFDYSVKPRTISGAYFTAFLPTNSPLRSYTSQRAPNGSPSTVTSWSLSLFISLTMSLLDPAAVLHTNLIVLFMADQVDRGGRDRKSRTLLSPLHPPPTPHLIVFHTHQEP